MNVFVLIITKIQIKNFLFIELKKTLKLCSGVSVIFKNFMSFYISSFNCNTYWSRVQIIFL